MEAIRTIKIGIGIVHTITRPADAAAEKLGEWSANNLGIGIPEESQRFLSQIDALYLPALLRNGRQALASMSPEERATAQERSLGVGLRSIAENSALDALTAAEPIAGAAASAILSAQDASENVISRYLDFIEVAGQEVEGGGVTRRLAGYASEEFEYNNEKFTLLTDATRNINNIKLEEDIRGVFVILDEDGEPISNEMLDELNSNPGFDEFVFGVIFEAHYSIREVLQEAPDNPNAYQDYIDSKLSGDEFITSFMDDMAQEKLRDIGITTEPIAPTRFDNEGYHPNYPELIR